MLRASSVNIGPVATVEQFLAARQARNLDAAMEYFVDQPELRTSLGVSWAGRDAVRAIMAYRLADDYTVDEVHGAGNRVTWTEHVRRSVAGAQPVVFDEDVEALLVGGRIASLVTYVGGSHPPPLSPTTSQVSPRTNLLVLLSVLVLVAGAVLVWPPPAEEPMRRVGDGRLLAGLREYVARRD